MPTTTLPGHVSRALDFFDRSDVYIALGRPNPWPDSEYGEEIVPPPTLETPLDNAIGYKKLERSYLVVPDDVEGTIIYRNRRWRIVPRDRALAEGARWVYVEVLFQYDELPVTTYRQIGVYSRLVRSPEVQPYKAALLPSEVQDPGLLEVIDNRRPTPRSLDQRETITMVIEF